MAPALVAAAGVILTLIVAVLAYGAAEARRRERFEQLADETVAVIDARVDNYVALLRGAAGLFAASRQVSAGEFGDYVARIDLEGRYPGALGMGYIVWLGPGAAPDARTFVRDNLPADVRPWPEPPPAQSAVTFIQPLDRDAVRALGFDPFSEPVRHEAMARARDEGTAAATGRISLMAGPVTGFVVYFPVYDHGVRPTTIAERRSRLVGWVYSPFRAPELFRQTFARGGLLRQVQVEVIDGGPGGPPLFVSGPPPRAAPFTTDRALDAAGRPWTVRVRSLDLSPWSQSWLPTALVVLSGLLITGASTWAAWLQARGLRRAREAETEARQAHEQTELLLYEVNHRVANSLQLVASLVGLQSESVQEPAARRALEDTRARILAVGRVHQRLYQAGQVEHVELCGYLRHLVEELAESLEGGARLRLGACEEAWLSPDKAVAVGVAVAELVTNAVKYAYPDGVAGDVQVSLGGIDGRLFVEVRDWGVGFQPDVTRGTGLGMKVVRAMATNLAAEVEIEPTGPGTSARLIFAAD